MCRSAGRGGLRGLVVGGMLALAASLSPARTPTDYEVKAAFLLHFTRLVEWPGAAEAEPVVVAVLENDHFADVLQKVAGSQAGKRPLRIVRGHALDRVARPHVLFVGTHSAEEARRVCATLGAAPVLTVGDMPGFATDGGGIIGFRLTDDRRVTFDVNLARSRAAGLRISSQLLKVARVVEDKP